MRVSQAVQTRRYQAGKQCLARCQFKRYNNNRITRRARAWCGSQRCWWRWWLAGGGTSSRVNAAQHCRYKLRGFRWRHRWQHPRQLPRWQWYLLTWGRPSPRQQRCRSPLLPLSCRQCFPRRPRPLHPKWSQRRSKSGLWQRPYRCPSCCRVLRCRLRLGCQTLQPEPCGWKVRSCACLRHKKWLRHLW